MADSEDLPVPPATFGFLVESILMQAQMQLGLLKFEDEEGEPEPNLALARHSIDLLGVLEEKTRGNLSWEEQRLLENGLTELRFRFVQAVEEAKRKASPSVEGSLGEDAPRILTADGGKGTKSA